jgi:hypothetical protein
LDWVRPQHRYGTRHGPAPQVVFQGARDVGYQALFDEVPDGALPYHGVVIRTQDDRGGVELRVAINPLGGHHGRHHRYTDRRADRYDNGGTVGDIRQRLVVARAPAASLSRSAGGTGHGSFVAGSQSWHPNTVSVGIEIHCAGDVRQVGGEWQLLEAGKSQGAAIPDDDVVPDPRRSGRGWHKVTDYQYQQLGLLLDGLETVLAALPDKCVAQSIETPPAYRVFQTGRVVGHASLHAAQRDDPWPPTCDWTRALP